ncbi:alcohol dehydrogenase catalytic domain-containing protein [Frigidibacter albus]|uniref:Alcohol dehydrogenase catalytic domain-containing protein n=1 Tax=Frigidibacter albus TaxID=1465486 RepID=A0A6L8VEQ3_9RHOB|nr:L-idonate 5-dehydrogenase [Frigidibacter albus]MZQ87720.1 alcohol dehydrogenase catalytic domain-containing protein [Frigidibacter albus]NBE29626.1 alcohol dehydrogenase catalytic domain-containing protein [Frigidibacter albus]GGH43711.1 L-idonate 5-dehydrogenase [Frigidibacter albus]
MQAIVIHAPNDLRLDTRPEAMPPQAGEVRVNVARGGICGSDLHYHHHGGFGAVKLREPMVLGHEVSGVVAEVGGGVSGLAAGDKVAINPSMPCNECAFCRKGMRNHCTDMRFSGSAMRFPHQQGLFRQGVTLPAAQLIRLSPGTDLGTAACAEPFAVCLHAVRQAGGLTGARVLVSGCGPIGCLTTLAASRAGAQEVIATDLSDPPLDIARRLGATRVINLAGSSLDDLAAGKGTVDVVFECSGNPRALLSAFTVLKPGGLLVLVGLGADATLPLSLLVTKEIRTIGSFRFDSEFAQAVDLIDRGVVDLSPLITATLPMSEAIAAFERAGDRSRSMKVQIAFDAG